MGNPVVVVYSNMASVREDIIMAVGRRVAPDLGRIDYVECATFAELLTVVDSGNASLVILDGEAQPVGGFGISRQIYLEAAVIPPIILYIRRAVDRWLATWAKADEILQYPLDPVTAADTVAAVLRRNAGSAVATA